MIAGPLMTMELAFAVTTSGLSLTETKVARKIVRKPATPLLALRL
ncbi:hypothetical protein DES45_1094 [Microvirga subterranea]|uniref:Uncharacterized protein n=1 Tax=Microvirga subterranea TaxID=186651 RepID=A0A370HFX0_9HYPH|nr:hypothetical protein DES45_1094 [Microvirga subterranea]